jgi:hypothetical protein
LFKCAGKECSLKTDTFLLRIGSHPLMARNSVNIFDHGSFYTLESFYEKKSNRLYEASTTKWYLIPDKVRIGHNLTSTLTRKLFPLKGLEMSIE